MQYRSGCHMQMWRDKTVRRVHSDCRLRYHQNYRQSKMDYSTRAGRLSPGYLACIAVCLAVTVAALPESPHLLNISCPNPYHDHDNFTISIDWTSTSFDGDIVQIWIEKVCLNGNNTNNNISQERFNNSFHRSLVVHPGTVCLFKGSYVLNSLTEEPLWSIRLESCEVPALQSTGKAQLQLNCSDSVATVEVVTLDRNAALNSTNLMGKCITPDWMNGKIMEYTRYLEAGNTTISGLPDNTICSFYGTYQLQTSEVVDFEPVQCIMNRPSPPTIPLPLTTTEDTTTITTTTSATSRYSATATSTSATLSETSTSATSIETSTIATSIESTNATSSSATSVESATTIATVTTEGTSTPDGIVSAFVVAISFMVSMAIMVTLALMAAACSAWKCYHWKMRRKQMKQLHIWDCFPGKEDLDQDPHVLPQFPHAPDSLSISTEVDYLYKEEGRTVLSHTSLSSLMKSMKNDEKAIGSPKLIMDQFLNGSHQRVWESSHESLSNVPPSPTQEQASSKLTELPCAETGPICDGINPVPSDSNLVSDSGNLMAQRFTLNTNQQYNLDDSITRCAADGNRVREFTPSSVPTEHYFTDDEGYLRFTK